MAASFSLLPLPYILLVLVVAASVHSDDTDGEEQVYIVYMGSLPEGEYSPLSHHVSILQEAVRGSASDSLVRSYHRSFNAFAARLSNEEVQKISALKEVMYVFPSTTFHLQTTRSWDFMGFTEDVKRNPTVESDVIVGIIDGGIWPELESFSSEGFGPPPKKWKGKCDVTAHDNLTCNNKIIGARHYGSQVNVRDKSGHGSHVASTIAGNKVSGVSFYRIGKGNARGGAPSARIAVYSVCNPYAGCAAIDILAAFDDAIADGVDIISCSIAGYSINPLKLDAIAIGAFHAMEKRILTVQAVGNSGPYAATIESKAPWILSVAASSIDRRIIDPIVLGNGKKLIGNAVNSFTLNETMLPIAYGKQASTCLDGSARLCSHRCLEPKSVKNKIVLCDYDQFTPAFGEAVTAGAKGAILLGLNIDDYAPVVPLPASILGTSDRDILLSYFNSTKNPKATIPKSTALKDTAAPLVASFSSRGPNNFAPEILKPDITAPGIDILVAYPPIAGPSGYFEDKRSSKFSIMSGTSMSCPHVTGAAAYVKTYHPHWSPSAIKSALLTTAWPMNATKHKDQEFAYGAGHLNPAKALHPGLVYEITKEDYLAMLCSMDNSQFGKCPRHTKVSPKDLNYPTMAFKVKKDKPFKIAFPRTVRNVGLPNSTYEAKITGTYLVKASVKPGTLSFKSLNEKQSFMVTVTGDALSASADSMASTSLVWSDGTHSVRSPIVVFTDSGPSTDVS